MASQEMKERCLSASHAALGHTPRKGKQGPEWIWLTCVHSRIAANSQEAEAAAAAKAEAAEEAAAAAKAAKEAMAMADAAHWRKENQEV